MEKEKAERKIAQATQARQDLEALNRAQGLAHAYWLKADTAPKRLWSITGRQLQEAITDTERYLRDLEAGT